jgi:hypothetical protein
MELPITFQNDTCNATVDPDYMIKPQLRFAYSGCVAIQSITGNPIYYMLDQITFVRRNDDISGNANMYILFNEIDPIERPRTIFMDIPILAPKANTEPNGLLVNLMKNVKRSRETDIGPVVVNVPIKELLNTLPPVIEYSDYGKSTRLLFNTVYLPKDIIPKTIQFPELMPKIKGSPSPLPPPTLRFPETENVKCKLKQLKPTETKFGYKLLRVLENNKLNAKTKYTIEYYTASVVIFIIVFCSILTGIIVYLIQNKPHQKYTKILLTGTSSSK